MKRHTFYIAAAVLFRCIAFKKSASTNKAEVNSIQGMMIFTDSKPVADYKYIGTVSLSAISFNEQYQEVRDKLIKKAKKQYPDANAIILQLSNDGNNKADVIKVNE